MRRKITVFVFLISLIVAQAASAVTFKVDPDHTTVEFRVRHVFSYVKGTFDQFDGMFDYDADHPETWKAKGLIQAASINTRVVQRDNHLRSKDFFEVEKFPIIDFKTTDITDVTPKGSKVHGVLTIRGIAKPVVLDVAVHGVAKDPWGNVRAGLTATTTINRKDFGLTWNQVLEAGQLLVGEEVEITVEVEGIAQK